MIQYQILQTHNLKIVWQTKRRITNLILGIKIWFTPCLILITNLGRKRSWDSTFLLVSTVHVPVKCKLSSCFSTSAEEYQAKMPQYFFIWTAARASVEYNSHVLHVSTNYLYIVCVTYIRDSQLSLNVN